MSARPGGGRQVTDRTATFGDVAPNHPVGEAFAQADDHEKLIIMFITDAKVRLNISSERHSRGRNRGWTRRLFILAQWSRGLLGGRAGLGTTRSP
jgi:hypothetical protein